MKIVSWNCNGSFRTKFEKILTLNADVYVIQECENPSLYITDDFNYVWIEHSKHKGLGVFAKKNILLKNNSWNTYGLESFLSVKVNDFDIIGVWACQNYIEDYFVFQEIYKKEFTTNTIIIGDFNSSSLWDKKHGKRNHTQTVFNLKECGFESIYHYLRNEKQGEETTSTYFMYRHIDKPYHIDYCFIHPEICKNFQILDTEWLKYSDHVPLVVEI